jgi:outer membrane protein OmpA-like peptidoglycan-associated protein
LNKLFKIFLLALVVLSSSTAIAQANSENTVIVSGFVLNSTTQEGITANITIKNAESFRVVTVIPTSNLSGSYTFKLVKGRYYFVVETPGFELFSVLVDLSTVSDKRIQRNLVLLPVGAIRNGYFPVQDNNGNDGSLNGEPVASSSSSESSSNTSTNNSSEDSSSDDEMGWGDSNPEANESIESSASTDNAEQKEDDIDVQIVKPGERLVENGKVVYTGVPVSSSGKIIKEAPEDIMNSEGTSNVEDIGEGRESEINFTIKGSAQFVDVPMYFNKNDANTVNVSEQMKLVLDFLRKNPSLEIEIRGYSETGFSNAMQKQIALQRSVNVKKYFSDNGISMTRLEAIAYPTSDYELVVERKRLYRKQHLVEFRIKGDDAFEQDFRARFEEEYSQYKEGDVPQVTLATITDVDNSITNTRSDLNSDSDVKQGTVNNDNTDLNTFTTSSNNSVSSNSSNSNTDSSITIAASSSTSNSVIPPSPAVTSPKGTVNNTGSVNNDDNAVIGNEISDTNRKNINGIEIDSEGSDYQIGYEGYNPNSDTVVTKDVFDALDKINASADRIDRMTISFEAKLAEVDEYKYKSVFDSIYIFLMNNRRWSLDIYGYASKKGDKKEASILHKNRAQNVYHVLINKGVDKTRIKFKGKGNAMSKTASGEKIPVEKQMIVTFKLKKPNLSGMNDNVKVDKTAQRGGSNSGREAGREAGRDNSSGAKTNYDDSNGYDDLRTQEGPAMPEFKTEMEYIKYLKNNQGQLSVPGLYFRVQVGAFNLPLDSKNKLFKIKNIELLEGKDGMYRYVTEKYVGINDAYTALKKVKRKVDDAFVLAFYKNQKITMKEATQMLLEKRK